MPELFMPRPGGPEAIEGESFVIVGANGAGKSRLGAWLEEHGGGSRPTHRISAQRALQMPEFIQPLARERAERRLFFGLDAEQAVPGHRVKNRWQGNPVGNLLNDFDALLASLWAEESERDAVYVKETRADAGAVKLAVPDSRLDTLKRIWHELLPHRAVSFDGGKVMASVVDKPGQRYHGRHMSDGERVMMYLVGQALCAPRDAVLIIDEPEIHLHRALRDRLWDLVEEARRDCLFVFITHDLEFAASRETARILWVRSFEGGREQPEWDWSECPVDTGLPTALVLQVLGSRKPVVFVEGDSVSSLDTRLYRAVYPSHRIIPVSGWENVDRFVSAMRGLDSLHHLRPFGIVDRDHRSPEYIKSLADRGVTCCPYAEVENLLMDERVLRAVAARAGTPDPDAATSAIKAEVLGRLKEQRDRQAAEWGEAVVAYRLQGFSCKENDPAKVQAAMEAHAKAIDVARIYGDARARIDSVLRSGDYAEALRVFNQKGLSGIACKALALQHRAYERMAVMAVTSDPGLRQHLAALVPLHG